MKENSSRNDESRTEAWKIRQCQTYKDEYKDCKSIRGRFQQIFVFGKTQDCSQWKIDYKNCCEWEDTNADMAYDALVESENKRRVERLVPHYLNDVWTKRENPPEDWDGPLPLWMQQRFKSSFLQRKKDEIENGKLGNKNSSCHIM